MPVQHDHIDDSDIITGSDGAAAVEHFPATPNDPFWLIFWPNRSGSWQVETAGLDGPTWLPVIQREFQSPGVNGYRLAKADRGASHVYRRAHESLRERGAVVIPRDATIGGLRGYMRAWTAKSPLSGAIGTFHTDRWSSKRQPLPGKRPKLPFDRAAYNRWRLSAVLEGVIDSPDPAVLTALTRHSERAFERVESAANMPEAARVRKLAELGARVDLVRGAWVPSPGAIPPWDAAEKAVGRIDGDEALEEQPKRRSSRARKPKADQVEGGAGV